MAHRDLARMRTNSTGTGPVVMVDAAPGGFLTFNEAELPDGQTSYAMVWGSGETAQRETGRGTWTSATQTLTRDICYSSTNDNDFVDIQGASEFAVTVISQDLADLAGGNGGTFQSTFLQSGGQVVWQSGLTFLVSAATYFIQGVQYQSAQQTITLDAADGSNPRIDVIAVDDTGTVVKVTGTAAASPSEPLVDPGSQLKLAIVTVAAGASAPTVTNTTIYAENAGGPGEWNGATSGTGYTLNSTTDPRTGSTHVTATNLGTNAYVQWDKPSGSVDPSTQNFLVFHVKSTAAWGNGRGLNVNLLSSGVVRGVTIPINRTGSYGFDSTNTTIYQQIAIPLTHFAVTAGQTFNQVRFTRFGGAISFRMDDVGLQSGGSTGGGGTSLTKEQADALYQPLDGELTAIAGLTSAANKLPYFTGSGAAAVADLTAFARTVLDDSDAETARATLGLTIGTHVQAYDADLAALAGISGVQGDIIYYNGTQWTRLAANTSGQFLKTQGSGQNPTWATPTGNPGSAGFSQLFGAMVRLSGNTAGNTGAFGNVLWDTLVSDTTWNPGDGGNVQRFWLGANFTFVDADVNTTDNTITEASHGFVTGEGPFRLTNSGGALPGGSATATNYWAISVDANTFKLATSRANAIAGTAVDITSAAGGGTHTCDRGSWLVIPKGVTYAELRGLVVENGGTLAGGLIVKFYKEGAWFVGSSVGTFPANSTTAGPLTSAYVPVSEGDRFSLQQSGDDAYNMTGGTAENGAWFQITVR